MRAPPPIVTGGLSQRTRSLLARYAGFEPAPGDPSDALVEAFAHLAGIVADRINRAPEKNLLAFLELIGVRPLPPQAARVAVTFHLAGGAPGALVPAGTAIASPPLEGETEPVPYETEEELVVTAARLTTLIAHEPVRDRYAVHAPGQPFEAFAGDVALARRLYVGFADLALPGEDKTLTIEFLGPDLSWIARLSWELADDRWPPTTTRATASSRSARCRSSPSRSSAA